MADYSKFTLNTLQQKIDFINSWDDYSDEHKAWAIEILRRIDATQSHPNYEKAALMATEELHWATVVLRIPIVHYASVRRLSQMEYALDIIDKYLETDITLPPPKTLEELIELVNSSENRSDSAKAPVIAFLKRRDAVMSHPNYQRACKVVSAQNGWYARRVALDLPPTSSPFFVEEISSSAFLHESNDVLGEIEKHL